MRLICGLMQLDGAAASRDLLRAMAAQMDVPRLRPRLILWCVGPIGLAVLDFAASGAAAVTELPKDDIRTLAADVRLDEADALARVVRRDASGPQDDLLLAALQQFGVPGLGRVLGDFVFASWDRKAERLVCGRDVFGVRPLSYVHRPGELFAFASLPKALHGAGIVAKTIDEDALARRIARSLRHDDSLIAGIKRLPPAHVVEVSREDILLKRYWQLDRGAAGQRQCSAEEAAREMRRLVTQAVHCRLPRAGTVASQLSGGLDSSAVTVLAARQLREQGRRLCAYSFLDRQRNDIMLADESEFMDAVLQQETDIDWTPIRRTVAPSFASKAVDADTMRPLPDAPDGFYARVEAQGAALVLSGWGGDEGATYNGRGALAELFLRGKWRLLAREISALSRERNSPRRRVLRSEVLSYILADSPAARVLQLVKRVFRGQNDLGTLFRRSLSRDARRRLAAADDEPLSLTADGRENRWRLLTSAHIVERLENNAHIAARHGFAFAFPLLDRRVVEFALSLPSELFVRDGLRRRPFRDAMADVLPAKLRLEERKLAPYPTGAIDRVAYREELLAKIEIYEKNELIRRTLDLAWLRRQVEAFPSADEVREELRAGRQPATAPKVAAVLQGLAAAAYLEEHGGK